MSSLIRTRSWPDLKSARDDLDGLDANNQALRKVKEDMLEMKNEMNKLKKQNDSLSEENRNLQKLLMREVGLLRNQHLDFLIKFRSFKEEEEDCMEEILDKINAVKRMTSARHFQTLKFINGLEQELVASDLVVEGLPKNSDYLKSVMLIGDTIKCPISSSDISICFSESTNVIVKFAHGEKKLEFLSKANTNSKHLWKKHEVSIRERLTKDKEILLQAAKRFVKGPSNPQGIYMNAWCEGGKVYVQKSQDNQAFHINSLNDLPKRNRRRRRRN